MNNYVRFVSDNKGEDEVQKIKVALAEEEDMDDDLESGHLVAEEMDAAGHLGVDNRGHRLSTASSCLSSEKPKPLAKNVKVSHVIFFLHVVRLSSCV